MFCVRCLLSFSPAHTQTLVGILPLLTHRTIEEHALNLATYGRGLQCQDSVYALQVEYEGDCTWKILCKCKSICIKQLWTRSTSSDKNVKPFMLALYLEYTKQYHHRIAECIHCLDDILQQCMLFYVVYKGFTMYCCSSHYTISTVCCSLVHLATCIGAKLLCLMLPSN